MRGGGDEWSGWGEGRGGDFGALLVLIGESGARD